MKHFTTSTTLEPLMDFIYNLNCIRKLRMGGPTIIYQMGKVGSISVLSSLKTAGVRPLFHTHFLNYNHKSSSIRRLYHHVFVLSVPTKIISLTREPFSRNTSSFFQRFSRIRPGEKIERFTAEELIDIYFKKYYHHEPLVWFDVELKRVTKVDVYDRELIDNEYLTAKRGNFEVLVLKSELPNSRKEAIIGDFMNIDSFKIADLNVTKEKKYASLYREFKDKIVYEQKYVDETINSKYFKFFYNDEKDNILDKIKIK